MKKAIDNGEVVSGDIKNDPVVTVETATGIPSPRGAMQDVKPAEEIVELPGHQKVSMKKQEVLKKAKILIPFKQR